MTAPNAAAVPSTSGNTLPLTLLYACTIFLSAFLLFQVQPIMGKLILPWFGGSAAVWTTCMLFFQLLLLGGYMYCHWLVAKLSPRWQSAVHVGLICAAIVALPILPDAGWKPTGEEDPVLRILGLLAAAVGLPYFVLSTTGPLMQAWFSRERPGSVPYRLFALSNLGSMVALLGYPFLIEPYLPARLQASIWGWGFIAFALLCGALALRGAHKAFKQPDAEVHHTDPGPAPGFGRYTLWALLAACPSLLLVAITSYLTQNVAPVPLLWVLPLALYLLSFILTFEHKRWYRRLFFAGLTAASMAALAYLPSVKLEVVDVRLRIAIYLVALFSFCMACHGELVRRSPPPARLTSFYLMISLGGALGGLFVGFIAPHYFVADYELHIGLVLTAVLLVYSYVQDTQQVVCPIFPRLRLGRRAGLVLASVGIIALAVNLGEDQFSRLNDAVAVGRNFYGALRISEDGKGPGAMRTLSHGRIIHGRQFLEAHRRATATTYYGVNSGVGLAIRLTRDGDTPQKVGVVGLGVGTLLTYGRAGDEYRVYEINALVVDLAKRYFTFMNDARAKMDLVLGDARLSMEREAPQQFDLLVVDAFSGDAVPGHLLTKEAFALYARHLKPKGVLAIHVSNKFLNLAPVVRLGAEPAGFDVAIFASQEDKMNSVYYADWVLAARDATLYQKPELAQAREIMLPAKVQAWTDDYNSLMPILK